MTKERKRLLFNPINVAVLAASLGFLANLLIQMVTNQPGWMVWPPLLSITSMVIGVAAWQAKLQKDTEQYTTEMLQEMILQTSLLAFPFQTSQASQEVQSLAHARLKHVLNILDRSRKASLIRFLSENGLVVIVNGDEHQIIDLQGVSLAGANLREANLQYVDLSHADLRGADLTDASLMHTKLTNAKLDGATLCHTDLSQADVAEATVEGANLRKAILVEVDLSRMNLEHLDLREAKLCKAQFYYASLRGSNLSGAQLQDAKFKAANLEGCCLSGANLSGADLSGDDERVEAGPTISGGPDGRMLIFTNRRVVVQTNLRRIDLRGAILKGTKLDHTDLRGALMTKEQLLDVSSYSNALLPDSLTTGV